MDWSTTGENNMMLSVTGNKWIIANHIYKSVGGNRFRCSDVDMDFKTLRCNLKDMCDCGILIKYRLIHRGRVHEYQLSPEAVDKIRRYGD